MAVNLAVLSDVVQTILRLKLGSRTGNKEAEVFAFGISYDTVLREHSDRAGEFSPWGG